MIDRDLKHLMPYGPDEQVTLVVNMPVHECRACGLVLSVETGEETVAYAVARYRRALAPTRCKPAPDSLLHRLHRFTQGTVLPTPSETLLLIMDAKAELECMCQDWLATLNALTDARATLQESGARFSWLDPAIDIAAGHAADISALVDGGSTDDRQDTDK
jgi:hypothetical protein